ncbi:MAG: helix-turn-helix transcriptional regulator [Planctomycetes bacterium]|nr:helix-turn-helix transcriptional regulator [Planctomycetota bacterium]
MRAKSVNPRNARRGTLSPKLRILAAGLTCSQVARQAGLTRSAISRHVSGDNRRSVETRERILDAFNALTGRNVTYRRFWANARRVG